MGNNGGQRVGGLTLDPAVVEWQQTAARNMAALTKKQRKDRKRIRVRYDVPPWLKTAVEQAAEVLETSASQAGAFFLAWGLAAYRRGDPDLLEALENAKEANHRSPRFVYDLRIEEI